jgi:hypothetical protein
MNLLLGLWYGDGKADADDGDGVTLLPAIISTCTSLSDAHIPPPTKKIDQKKEKEKLTSSVRATQTINERIRSRNFFSYLQNTQTNRELSEKKAKKKKINERDESRGRETRREPRGREEIEQRKRGRHLFFCIKKIHRKWHKIKSQPFEDFPYQLKIILQYPQGVPEIWRASQHTIL